MGLLDHTVILGLIFGGSTTLSLITAAPFYNPTSSAQGPSFLNGHFTMIIHALGVDTAFSRLFFNINILQVALHEDEHFSVDFFKGEISEQGGRVRKEEKVGKAKLTGVKNELGVWLLLLKTSSSKDLWTKTSAIK